MKVGHNDIFTLDGRKARVIHRDGNILVFFWLDSQRGEWPFQLTISALEGKIIDETAMRLKDDPFAYSLLSTEPRHIDIAKKRLSVVSLLFETDGVYYKETRGAAINRVVDTTGIRHKAVYSWLRLYWQRGLSLCALLPAYHLSGGKGKRREDTSRLGAKRKYLPGRAPSMIDEFRQLFNRVITKYLLSDKQHGPAYAYRRFVTIYNNLYPDTPETDRPTQRQFEYYYRTEMAHVTKIRSRTKEAVYQNDVQPLRGTAVQNLLGPGSQYEIDATIADIYVLSDTDPSKIIGRPTLFLLVDTFSRLIVGFYIGVESPSYATAMRTLLWTVRDWHEYEEYVGLNLDNEREVFNLDIEDDLYHEGGLPRALLADRGELYAHQIEFLSSWLNVDIRFASPGRAISKGVVERQFRSKQATFKKTAPGVVEGITVKKRGGHDYRLDATLTLKDFQRRMYREILLYNNFHVISEYTPPADMPTSVPAVPRALWEWGMAHQLRHAWTCYSPNARFGYPPKTLVADLLQRLDRMSARKDAQLPASAELSEK